jgi:hypothetical protein
MTTTTRSPLPLTLRCVARRIKNEFGRRREEEGRRGGAKEKEQRRRNSNEDSTLGGRGVKEGEVSDESVR